MPVFIKSLWVIGLAGVFFIINSLMLYSSPEQVNGVKKLTGTIDRVECIKGARSFMKNQVTLVGTNEESIVFYKDGECPLLEKEFLASSKFSAYQVKAPLLSQQKTVYLELDGKSQLDFKQEQFNFNLSLFLSPFIIPLVMAIGSTYNWKRGRWKRSRTNYDNC